MDKLQLRLDPVQSQLIINALQALAIHGGNADTRYEAGKLAALVAWRHARYFGQPASGLG